MAECAIAFGGNMGAPDETFRSAARMLAEQGISSQEMSSLYSTAAMGADAGEQFTNAVMVGQTELAADQLLGLLHWTESQLGRERTIHWGPRVIDLDLIYLDQIVIDTPDLVVPHPAMWYRHFVLNPLAELRPGWVHPILKETIQTLKSCLSDLTLQLHLGPELTPQVSELSDWFPDVVFTDDSTNWSFAQICLSEPTDERKQPRHESGRVIRVSSQNLESAVRNVIVATGRDSNLG